MVVFQNETMGNILFFPVHATFIIEIMSFINLNFCKVKLNKFM